MSSNGPVCEEARCVRFGYYWDDGVSGTEKPFKWFSECDEVQMAAVIKNSELYLEKAKEDKPDAFETGADGFLLCPVREDKIKMCLQHLKKRWLSLDE